MLTTTFKTHQRQSHFQILISDHRNIRRASSFPKFVYSRYLSAKKIPNQKRGRYAIPGHWNLTDLLQKFAYRI